MVFPLLKDLCDGLNIKRRIIGGLQQITDVDGLKVDCLERIFNLLFPADPFCSVGGHGCFTGQRDSVQHDISRVPSLGIKHIEGEVLILHA